MFRNDIKGQKLVIRSEGLKVTYQVIYNFMK